MFFCFICVARSWADEKVGSVEAKARRKYGGQQEADERTLTSYSEEQSFPHKKPSSAANDVIYWERHILPRLGSKTVRSVTRGDITSVHNSISQEVNSKGQLKTTTANRVLEVLKKAFNLAEDWEWRSEGPDAPDCCRFRNGSSTHCNTIHLPSEVLCGRFVRLS